MHVSELVKRFVAWHGEHNSEPTARYYRQGLAWLVRTFGGRTWPELGRDALLAGLRAANKKPDGTPWAADTLRRNTIALDQLQKWAVDQEYVDAPVLRPKDLKKPGGALRERIPSDEELERLLAAADPPLQLALRALAQSGMRPSELCRCEVCHLSTARDLITLRTHKTAKKTGRPKEIALGERMQQIVAEALGERTEGPVWIDEQGRAWTAERLSARFRRLRERLGLDRRIVLYCLRHYRGDRVAREADIWAAKEVLGHAQIATTQRYLHARHKDKQRWQDL